MNIYLNLNEGLKEIRFTSTGLRNNTGVSFHVGDGGTIFLDLKGLREEYRN